MMERSPAPPLAADLGVWWRIGWQSFGGPAGQIPLLHRKLVEERGWISPERFAAGLDLCVLLPGPEAQQLATYIGWTRQGWRGGLAAGGLFVLPGALVMLALSAIYCAWGASAALSGLFTGLQCAVVAIVGEALFRFARKSVRSAGAVVIAAAAFAALVSGRVPFWAVVLGGLAAGLLLPWPPLPGNPATASTNPATERRASSVPGFLVLAVWVLLLAALLALVGRDATLSRIAVRYAELALLSFGGAYALLGGLTERAVADGWLTAAALTDGLALAEATPGPLILVLQFVAFVTAHGAAPAAPFAAGVAASAVAVAVLHLPSFAWIFLAAPHLERVERSPALRRASAGVAAAVLGLIGHLWIWIAIHVLFPGGASSALEPSSLDPGRLALVIASTLLLVGAKQSMVRVLAIAALAGLLVGAL
jgi:chromate transporter